MATSVKVIMKDLNKFEDALKGNVEAADKAARNIVEKGGLIIASAARKQFRPRPGGQKTSKTGRIYYTFKPPYNAIPPKPTSRSGKLQESVVRLSVTPTSHGWQSETGSLIKYAKYVEYGTALMTQEPFIATGAKESEGRLIELSDAEWGAI